MTGINIIFREYVPIMMYYLIGTLFLSSSIWSYTYSMYLMMSHNEEEYVKFLRRIYWFKLHWICCKYRFIVSDQLEEIDGDALKLVAMNSDSPEENTVETCVTTNDCKIKTNGCELSVESTIV